MVKARIQAILESVLREMSLQPPARLQIDTPRDRQHGDFSTNVALLLAPKSGVQPAELARRIAAALASRPDLDADVSVAGPGFINFRLRAGQASAALARLLQQGSAVGRADAGAGSRVQVEFVSANPTGPLNVVSARGAAYGSTLAAMLRLIGYDVQCEFYVNDAGRQVELFGASVRAHFATAAGRDEPVPADGYHGDYVRALAAAAPPAARAWLELPAPDSALAFGQFAVDRMLATQQADLERFGVRFERWFRESELYAAGAVGSTRRQLEASGHTYWHDGALFFRSTTWGDDKDRVLVRSDGTPTYFLADAAYHRDKHERGFRHVVYVWGPDHHGHVGRMQALARALGYAEDWLEVVIVQQVNLLEAGEAVRMSKRAGAIVTLADLMDEVGADVAKFFFLMRQHSSHLDFDLDLARRQSDENPVYYVKYAHARICSVIRRAGETDLWLRAPELSAAMAGPAGAPLPEAAALDRLETAEEQELIKLLVDYGEFVRRAAAAREPHRLTAYGAEVARAFHKFYHEHRVIQADRDLALARLALCHATRRVLASVLGLMSIAAPEAM